MLVSQEGIGEDLEAQFDGHDSRFTTDAEAKDISSSVATMGSVEDQFVETTFAFVVDDSGGS